MMQPTVIGGAVQPLTVEVQPVNTALVPAAPSMALSLLDTGQIILKEEQVPLVEQALAALDFRTITSGDIVQIGLGSERSLAKTLDGFLSRLNNQTAAKLFALFNRLTKGVDEADLPALLEEVKKPRKPTWREKLARRFKGKSAGEIAQMIWQDLANVVSGRSKSLAQLMADLERDLNVELGSLQSELRSLDQLKQQYRTHFGSFTVDAALAYAFLQRARQVVVAYEADPSVANDPVKRAELQELRAKLQLLESRALALEGTYTRLPADALVIQQLEQAGVSTLQEVSTTMGQRTSSIKMSLLALHGAFAVITVQQMSAQQAELDDRLIAARGALVKDAAVTAATMPGDNRTRQAQQIQTIITQFSEVRQLVAEAEAATTTKFATARQSFADSRAKLAHIG